MLQIDDFIARLSSFEQSSQVFNPYRNPQLAKNLRRYLNLLFEVEKNPVLLVGEAPGYKGCKLTGIPFSSGKIFEQPKHKLLKTLKPDLVIEEIDSENTATIVWEYLTRRKFTPLFWNSFPFHPFPAGEPNKNRAPSKSEMQQGLTFLHELYDIFQPVAIAGVGMKGFQSAAKCFPNKEIALIRHPSFGGKKDFVKGMNKLYRNLRPE